MMKILITGNEGFIGKHLECHLKKRQADIYGWDRAGITKNGEEFASNRILLKEEDVLRELSEINPNFIIHCAGNADVGNSVKMPRYDMESNYITTHNLLFSMKTLSMRQCRFVLLSSAAVYGNPTNLPISENSEKAPLSPYALHKQLAEETCLFMNKNYGLDTKIARIFSAYGPGLKKQIFWDMYQKIKNTGKLSLWGSGLESRDYIFIDDLIRAIDLVMFKAPDNEIVYNVANGEEITIREAAECFARCMGIGCGNISFMGIRREGEPVNWRADVSKLVALGYQKEVPFKEGVQRYIDWIRNLDSE